MFTMAVAARVLTEWVGDPVATERFGIRFSRPVVVPDDDRGAPIAVTGTVAENLDGTRVRVELVARSDGQAVLTRARAVVRLLPRANVSADRLVSPDDEPVRPA